MVTDLETIQSRVQRMGNEPVLHIASGMEGHVFRIGDQRVAKAWFHKPLDKIVPLKNFYASLQALNLPFATPEILDFDLIDGMTISIERELPGRSMRELVSDQDELAPHFAVEALTTTLCGLRGSEATRPVTGLPLQGILPSNEAIQQGANHVLAEVASTKVDQFGSQLRASVPEFDWIYTRAIDHLLALTVEKTYAIHGDLCSPNILLDDRGCVTAVLDWGFLSMFGDPAFDASITAGIFNMYGRSARAMDDCLVDHFRREFGYSKERMLLYRAIYAMITSNSYSPDGADGHYVWCVTALRREDIRAALRRDHIA